MWRRILFILASLPLIFASEAKGSDKLDLFLCIGQSNMAGRGFVTEGSFEVISGLFLFNNDAQFEPAKEPLNRYSTICKEIGMQRIGPIAGFAQYYIDKQKNDVGVVVNARGNTSIDQWLPNSTSTYLEQAVNRMKQAMKYGELKGVLWHQGEANCASVDDYEYKLGLIVAYLRKEFQDPSLVFIVGEIAHWNWTGRAQGTTTFNNMLNAISIPNTGVVSAENLTPLLDETDPHFSAESQRILGYRYAKEIIKLNN